MRSSQREFPSEPSRHQREREEDSKIRVMKFRGLCFTEQSPEREIKGDYKKCVGAPEYDPKVFLLSRDDSSRIVSKDFRS